MTAQVLPIIFIVVLIILAIVLAIVGVQLFLTLSELKQTIRRVNYYLDSIDEKIDLFTYPFRIISSFISGFGSGTKAVNSFSNWLKGNSESKSDK